MLCSTEVFNPNSWTVIVDELWGQDRASRDKSEAGCNAAHPADRSAPPEGRFCAHPRQLNPGLEGGHVHIAVEIVIAAFDFEHNYKIYNQIYMQSQ